MKKDNPMKDIVSCCVMGGALEWYSFAIYGFLSTVMGSNFFPTNNPTQQAIASLGAFAVGLLSRPIGAIVFGYISSSVGQKAAFSLSIYIMAIATFFIGLLPTYEQVGAVSTVSLLILRIFQGLALGGGFTGTMVFLYEHAPMDKKGRYTVWASFCLIEAFILCALISTIMSCIFDNEQLIRFAWRIPFVISLLGIVVANYVNKKLESAKNNLPKVDQLEAPKNGLMHELFVNNRWKFLTVMYMDMLTGCGFFIIAIFFTTYIETILNMNYMMTSISQIVSMIVFAIAVLVSGHTSDIFGRRKQMMIACFTLVLCAYPAFMLSDIYGARGAIVCQICIIIIFSMYHGAIPASICEMFPANVRLIGVAASHNLAMALFGAYSPSLATVLIQKTQNIASPSFILIISAIFTMMGVYFFKEKPHHT